MYFRSCRENRGVCVAEEEEVQAWMSLWRFFCVLQCYNLRDPSALRRHT
jgi:hypothetical protein